MRVTLEDTLAFAQPGARWTAYFLEVAGSLSTARPAAASALANVIGAPRHCVPYVDQRVAWCTWHHASRGGSGHPAQCAGCHKGCPCSAEGKSLSCSLWGSTDETTRHVHISDSWAKAPRWLPLHFGSSPPSLLRPAIRFCTAEPDPSHSQATLRLPRVILSEHRVSSRRARKLNGPAWEKGNPSALTKLSLRLRRLLAMLQPWRAVRSGRRSYMLYRPKPLQICWIT